MSQASRALEWKRKSENRLKRPLREWYIDVVAAWTPGVNIVPQEDVTALERLLLRSQELTVKDMVGDIREFKQDEEPEFIDLVIASMAVGYYAVVNQRNATAAAGIARTVEKNMAISQAAAETGREARRILSNYQRNHIGTVIATEGNYAVETARSVAVRRIDDPLKNTVRQMVTLLKADDVNGARRLQRQFEKAVKLPLSQKQGDVINYISDNRDRLITAFPQARAISSLERRAEALGSDEKMWETVGDGVVRHSHDAANGQTKPIDEPFELSGGLLQYPGDASLGASLGEVINCRCTAIYK